MSFVGKVVLVTGASSGIGADAVRHLAKLGAKVSMVDINEHGLNIVANQIKKSNSPAPLSIAADVTKDAERIVGETVEHFGRLDVLVNNAGIGILDNTSSMDLHKFDRVFNVNVRSAINLTKLCVPHLEKTKGNIVNVSSVAGLKVIRNLMSYSISKAALNQFTKCCALELASKGIRVNAINPATIRTPINENSGLTPKQIEKMLEFGRKMCIIGRIGEVSDTSAAIAFLANEETASFLTGILLPVDGGTLISHL